MLKQAFADPKFKDNLANMIVNIELDSRVFALIVNHVAGMPSRQVEHEHRGSVRLEQIVANRVPREDEDEDEAGES